MSESETMRAALAISDCRPEVLAFAVLMERELRNNDHKTGWKKCDPRQLNRRVREEADELREIVEVAFRDEWVDGAPTAWEFGGTALTRKVNGALQHATGQKLFQPRFSEVARIAGEAADVANMAMMVADVCGGLPALSAPPDTSALDRAYAALKPFADAARSMDASPGHTIALVPDDLRRAREVADELRRSFLDRRKGAAE